MATTDEIRRRVEEADTARSEKRSAAAERIGDLAQRRATIAEQLGEIERELGEVLAAAQDVIDLDELARFTDIPAAELTRWLTDRKTTRTKRKRSTAGASSTQSDPKRRPSPARTPTNGQASALPETTTTRTDALDAPARPAAEVS
jgi:hypothetical protein